MTDFAHGADGGVCRCPDCDAARAKKVLALRNKVASTLGLSTGIITADDITVKLLALMEIMIDVLAAMETDGSIECKSIMDGTAERRLELRAKRPTQ